MQKGQTQVLILAGIVLTIALAGGIFYLGRITAPKPENVITSSPQPSPTPDETANWKTYTNEKYSFELKHPSNAEITPQKLYSMLSAVSSDGISIAPPYQAPYDEWYSLDIAVRDNPGNVDAKSIINNYAEDIKKNCSPPACATPKKITDTLKPYKNGDTDGYSFYIGAETNSAMVVQVKNNKTYIFRMTGDQGNTSDYGLKLLNQILSTFRFD